MLLSTGLFRMAGPKKLADFLARNFSHPVNAAAAAKNAYVLLGQHKPELAAAFFVLGRRLGRKALQRQGSGEKRNMMSAR